MTSACENATTSSSSSSAGADEIFDTLTHISASVDVGLGLTAQAEIDAGGYSFGGSEPYSVVATAFALPTACVSFDAGAKSYAPATATAAGGRAGASGGHGGGRSGAAAGAVNPFGGQGVGLMGMVALSGLVLVGSVCFVLL